MEMEKFSSQMDSELLEKLREYCASSGRKISDVLTEALENHLSMVLVRPVFRNAVEKVLDEDADLLKRLAK